MASKFGDNVTKYAAGVSSSQRHRRQQRNEDFNNQNIKTAGDFDFDQYNRKDTKGTHISGAEINHLRRNHQSQGGTGNRQDTYDVLTKQKEAGATFGNRAQAQYDRMGKNLDAKKQRYIDHFNKIGKDEADSKALIEDYERNTKGLDADTAFEALEGGRQFDPKGGDAARYDEIQKRGDAKERAGNFKQTQVVEQASSQEQNVNQNNDINSKVTGDNNYVSNTQDNSVRYFGGNTTNFNYQSAGEGPDTPATMMTLAGIGKPQDSPADTAKFIGKYSTINSDLQKQYGNVGTDVASKYIARAAQTNPIDVTALDQNISQGIQQHYDRATQQQALYQGDVFNYKTPEFKMPEAPDPIKSNVSDIADDYKKDLDDD